MIEMAMRLFSLFFVALLTIGIASAQVSIVNDINFDLDNSAFIKILAPQTPTKITIYNSADSPASTLQFYINGSAVRFTSNTNKTLSNLSYDNVNDVVNYTGKSTSGGYLNISARMASSKTNYSFNIDGNINQTGESNATGWVTFNYSGWEVNQHEFKISIVSAIPTYLPPTPVNMTSSAGNFWINYTWAAGIGNVTDSYNVNVNGTWTNGSSIEYSNTSLSPHGWSNISVYSFNSSGTGMMNDTAVSRNIQVANNPVTIGNISGSYILTTGDTLSIYPTSSDLDDDATTFARNFSNGTFDANNGTLLWITTSSDTGIHYWQINVSDGYGSVPAINFTVTVNSPIDTSFTVSYQ